jgi:hypothetical protein
MSVKIERSSDGRSIKASLNGNGAAKSVSGGEPAILEGLDDRIRTLSGLISRAQLANRAGLQFDGNRDLYAVFGYKRNPTTSDYLSKYLRQDIATRVIDGPPGATWANPPWIVQEEANNAWKELNRKVKLWNAMYRADRLARLAPYSIVLFGFDDSTNLERPLRADGVKDLLYCRTISGRLVDEIRFNQDVRDPRFGFPELYTVNFDDPETKTSSGGSVTTKGIKTMKVHHSRVVHVVENALEDEVFGIPIIEKVYNLLDDLLKIAGGTSETYWLQGRSGIQADVDKEMEINPEDAAALADEIDEYMHQLRRFIRTRGVTLNTLDSKPPNPKEVFEMIISLISGTTGIPKRILLGSEAGQLASEQDRANWAERIEERRKLFCGPVMLEPTVDLLQSTGLLPDGEIEFEWPDAFIQNPLEKGQTMAQIARSIGNISRQAGNKAPMQLTSREEAREIIGLEGDLPEDEILEQPEDAPDNTAFSGGPNDGPDNEQPSSRRPPAEEE